VRLAVGRPQTDTLQQHRSSKTHQDNVKAVKAQFSLADVMALKA
jgi:hypothetical protein